MDEKKKHPAIDKLKELEVHIHGTIHPLGFDDQIGRKEKLAIIDRLEEAMRMIQDIERTIDPDWYEHWTKEEEG